MCQQTLMIGGLFLCFEGFEKVFHKFLGHEAKAQDHAHKVALVEAIVDPEQDMVAVEKSKIKGAIRTEFILSAEIIVISLGTLTAASIFMQFVVLCTIAILMTVGVYGLVAGIVKLDDLGVRLAKQPEPLGRIGRGILVAAPWLMTTLSVVGTAAMFLVGGGILAHGIPVVEHAIHGVAENAGAMGWLVTLVAQGALGVLAGGLVVAGWSMAKKVWSKKA